MLEFAKRKRGDRFEKPRLSRADRTLHQRGAVVSGHELLETERNAFRIAEVSVKRGLIS